MASPPPPPPPSLLLSESSASFALAMVPALASAQSSHDACSPSPGGQHMEPSVSSTTPGHHIIASPSSVLMEWASERTVNDLEVAEGPQRRASLPRKLQLMDEKQGNRHWDGRAGIITTGSPLSQPCEITPLSWSLPSPSFIEEKIDYEEPRTPPDMVFSCSCDVPPTPMAPKKSYKMRSTPLGKKQPRRLHFAEQGGHDVPAASCAPNAAAASEMTGAGTKCRRFSKFAYVDLGSRGSVPREFAGDAVESGAVTASECSKTPPDKVYNSFLHGKTPTAPKKLFGASRWRRQWQY